ncbi:hypothetical protein [Rhodococcus opacus]|nr:hypothetical protein [Rhodococcus opacus]MDJ0420766.1 hypothetical protein [Rhodococcus opacus]MDV6248068.1 hypothetical protein [Rhodococcus opacus]MDV7090936.1 hypothetical protein [Rhodococcus opacus]UNN04496.1 hypothetical protein MOO23_36175 [Rhodococcus opacus]
MPRLTEEQKKQRAADKVMRHALEAEERDRRETLKRLEWEKNGTYLTRAEFEANMPCRGCGRPFIDNRGPWPAQIHMTPAESAEYAAENKYYLDRHRDCQAYRTGIDSSRITHCGFCFPPPPLSSRQIDVIRKEFGRASKTPEHELDIWKSTLTCGHTVQGRQHRTSTSRTIAVEDCPECSARRGVVRAERIGPAAPPPHQTVPDQPIVTAAEFDAIKLVEEHKVALRLAEDRLKQIRRDAHRGVSFED